MAGSCGRWQGMRRWSARHIAGATLLEVVAVAALGVLTLGLAFGGMGLIAGQRLAGAARTLASDLRMLDGRARAERTCYRVLIDPATESYTILRYGGPITAGAGGSAFCEDAAAWSAVPALGGDTALASRRLAPGVDLVWTSFVSGRISISPLGNSNAGGVCLRVAGGRERWVRVEVLGRAEILLACP